MSVFFFGGSLSLLRVIFTQHLKVTMSDEFRFDVDYDFGSLITYVSLFMVKMS